MDWYLNISRGICIRLAVIVLVGIYALLIWFFLGSFGWQVALALALALPIILFPAAFVWYLNLGWIFFHGEKGTHKEEVRGVAAVARKQ